MVDKVRPLKLESSATGGTETNVFPTATDPAEDYLAPLGIAYGDQDDIRTYRDGNDLKFEDKSTLTGVNTLTDLKFFTVEASSPFSPWSAENGTSDPIPFENTNFETVSTMHDPTVSVNSTATSGGANTLTDTGESWTVNEWANAIVKITGGTGSGQWRTISSNTATVLTVASNWGTNPDATTTYRICPTAHKLVAPIAGKYLVAGHASIDYNANLLGIFFYKNGSFGSLHYTHQSQSVELNGQHSRAFDLAANDYMDMRIYNGDTVHRNMFGGNARLWFSMMRIG